MAPATELESDISVAAAVAVAEQGEPVVAAAAVAQPARDVSAFADAVKGSARAEVVETVLPELSHVWDGTLYSYLPRSCSDVICSWLAPSAEGAAL